MEQQESNLFEVKITETGKRYINRYAALSYTILVFVIFHTAILSIWNGWQIVQQFKMEVSPLYPEASFYNKVYPYISLLLNFLVLIANVYFLRFPRQLKKSIELNDTESANAAFRILFQGAILFLVSIIITVADILYGFLLAVRTT